MPRLPRPDFAGLLVHVLNRSVGRRKVFLSNHDYEVFELVLRQAVARSKIRLLAFCMMPNHWHMLVWPKSTKQLSEFLKWLTQTHTARWHATHDTIGLGAVYQGRFKAFPLESDTYLDVVAGYVERNALRAGLVQKAEDWPWGSLYHRAFGDPYGLLSEPPQPLRQDWVDWINTPQSDAELRRLQECARRGRPLGSPHWEKEVTRKLGLISTVVPRGGQAKGPWPSAV